MRIVFRNTLVAMLSVLAFSAVAVSAAQAAEGPFYKVAGTRLAEGESKELTAKGAITFTNPSTEATIKCESAKFLTGAKIDGSTGANLGSGEVRIEWPDCTTTGLGKECRIEGPDQTVALKEDLAFLNTTRSGDLVVVLVPKAGTRFITVSLNGNCTFTQTSFAGSLVAYLENSKGEKIEVGKEPAEAKTLQLKLASGIKQVYLESGGKLTAKATEMEIFSEPWGFEGTFTQELVGGTEWGVFTK